MNKYIAIILLLPCTIGMQAIKIETIKNQSPENAYIIAYSGTGPNLVQPDKAYIVGPRAGMPATPTGKMNLTLNIPASGQLRLLTPKGETKLDPAKDINQLIIKEDGTVEMS